MILSDLELDFLLAKLGDIEIMPLGRPGVFTAANVLALEQRLRDERDRRKGARTIVDTKGG